MKTFIKVAGHKMSTNISSLPIFYFIYVCILTYMSLCELHMQVTEEGRGHQIPWTWSPKVVNRYVGEGNKTRVLYQCSLPEPSHQLWKEIIWVVLRISQSIFNSHFCIFPAKPYHPFHFSSDSDKELCKLASTEPPGDGRVCISNFPAWRLARLSFPYIQNWKGRTAWLVLFFLIHCLFLYFVLSWC